MIAATTLNTKHRQYDRWWEMPQDIAREGIDALTQSQKLLLMRLLDLCSMTGGNKCQRSYRNLATDIGLSANSGPHIQRLVRQINEKADAGVCHWKIIRMFRWGEANTFRVVRLERTRPAATITFPRLADDEKVGRHPEPPKRNHQLELFEPPPPPAMRIVHPPKPRITDKPGPRIRAAIAPAITHDTPITWADQPREPRKAPPPADIFTPQRFNILAATPPGESPATRLINAVTAGEVRALKIRSRTREILAVKQSGETVWIHLAIAGSPLRTEPLQVAVAELGSLELLT